MKKIISNELSEIGPIIRLHREMTGKMQKEYAQMIGLSNPQMTRIEHGLNEPKEGVVLNMLEVLIPNIKTQIAQAKLGIEAELECRKNKSEML